MSTLKSTHCYYSEDQHWHLHCYENLKSQTDWYVCLSLYFVPLSLLVILLNCFHIVGISSTFVNLNKWLYMCLRRSPLLQWITFLGIILFWQFIYFLQLKLALQPMIYQLSAQGAPTFYNLPSGTLNFPHIDTTSLQWGMPLFSFHYICLYSSLPQFVFIQE